jgi:hypothetical protein
MRIPVAAEGWPFILPPAAAAVVAGGMGWVLAATLLGAVALAFLGFFRDPDRLREKLASTLHMSRAYE